MMPGPHEIRETKAKLAGEEDGMTDPCMYN